MPVRKQTQRHASLQKYIAMIYQKPAWKFLNGSEPWEPVRDLIYGPATSFPSRAEIATLKSLWFELRDDILCAQAEYAPDKKPWGCRFD
jgi:hypothetical protein